MHLLGRRRCFDFNGNLLMPFKKGQSGNPKGRPKDGTSWAAVLDKLCQEQIQVGKLTMSKKEAICRKLLQLASQGERWAIEALMDRIDGKPKQLTENKNENENKTIIIRGDDADL